MERLDLLKLRISAIIVRYKLLFTNSLKEYEAKLNQHFPNEKYNQDEIETVLNQIEEDTFEVTDEVIQIPEDFELINVKQK